MHMIICVYGTMNIPTPVDPQYSGASLGCGTCTQQCSLEHRIILKMLFAIRLMALASILCYINIFSKREKVLDACSFLGTKSMRLE